MMTISQKERLNKLEGSMNDIMKKVEYIEESLIHDNQSGSLIDSLNFMVQVNKKLNNVINELKMNMNQRTQIYNEYLQENDHFNEYNDWLQKKMQKDFQSPPNKEKQQHDQKSKETKEDSKKNK